MVFAAISPIGFWLSVVAVVCGVSEGDDGGLVEFGNNGVYVHVFGEFVDSYVGGGFHDVAES